LFASGDNKQPVMFVFVHPCSLSAILFCIGRFVLTSANFEPQLFLT
jgi:hypothetical protein